MTTSRTTLNAIIGYPLETTLSPAVHAAVYDACGIDAAMLAFPTRDAGETLAALKTLNVGLIAVTIPHKESVVRHIDEIDPLAKLAGAVNTIINRGGRYYGYNTDVDGIRFALGSLSLAGKHTLVIGAGGAARAAAMLVNKEKGKLAIANRTESRGRELADQCGGTFISLDELDGGVFDIILNMTPAGMNNETPIPGFRFTRDMAVFDCVYSPATTRLLLDAEKAGAHTISGIEMFIGQAVRQIELWSGRTIDPALVRAAVNTYHIAHIT